MPELPELEVIKDRLRVALAGRRVEGSTVNHPAVLKTVQPPLSDLHSGHLLGVTRRGKFLCLHSDRDRWLCFHLMLNGSLALGDSKRPLGRTHLLALHLDDGQDLRLIETGTRRRAAAHVVKKPEDVEWIAQLGLDPMAPEFSLGRFRGALGRRNRTVKRFLTDQRSIGGIGNCFSDEILHAARLSPFQLTGELKPEQVIRLHGAVKKVLHDAIINLKPLDHLPDRGDRTFLKVHSRLGQPCLVCGEEVRRVSYQDHTTFYCPGCQTNGRVLADRRLSKLLK